MTRIAAVQFSCRTDPEENMAKALELVRLAADKGAALVALPELALTPWFPREMAMASFGLAQTVPGPATDAFSRLARERQVVVVLPLFEKAEKGRYFNSAAVIDADGTLAGIYRKVHVPCHQGWHEKFYFLPGNGGFPVFPTRVGKVGVQICWDAFFPEGARILALLGAEVLVVPTANAHASQERWQKMIAGSAIANGLFILRVNRVGREDWQTFYGGSFCVDPHGDFLHRPAGSRDAVYLAKVEPEEVGRARSEWAFFRDRREKEYGDLLMRMPGADALGIPACPYAGGSYER